MKTPLAVLTIALTISFSATAYASGSIALTIKTNETLTLRKISKNRFEKIAQNAVGTAKVIYTNGDLARELISQDINETDNTSALEIEVTGKNVLRIEDTKERINQEVKAEIKKSLFGKIKTIKIEAKTMQGLYAASMKKSGLNVLKKLRVLGKGSIESGISTNDLNCKAEGDLLICKQDATLLLEIRY